MSFVKDRMRQMASACDKWLVPTTNSLKDYPYYAPRVVIHTVLSYFLRSSPSDELKPLQLFKNFDALLLPLILCSTLIDHLLLPSILCSTSIDPRQFLSLGTVSCSLASSVSSSSFFLGVNDICWCLTQLHQ
ncbi:hypothetical protein LINPERHAP1_LOCUS21470 [Linum perenne]